MKQETPTDESVIHEHLFGFCSKGAGSLDNHTCPGLYQRFHHGKVKQGRKSVDGLVYLDEFYKCSCLCHVPKDERPKPKRTRKQSTRRK